MHVGTMGTYAVRHQFSIDRIDKDSHQLNPHPVLLPLNPCVLLQCSDNPSQLSAMYPVVNGGQAMPVMSRHGAEPGMRVAHVAAERT